MELRRLRESYQRKIYEVLRRMLCLSCHHDVYLESEQQQFMHDLYLPSRFIVKFFNR